MPTAQRELRAADLEAVRDQLGREPTTPFTVVARCAGGHPLVIRNAPLDAAGDAVPDDLLAHVSRCRQGGLARGVRRVDRPSERAHGQRRGVPRRGGARARAPTRPTAPGTSRRHAEWGGVAGTRAGIKCLHAHYAYRLAGGDDPVGAWMAERVEPVHPEQRPGRVAAIDQGTNSIRLLVVEPGATPDDPRRPSSRVTW